MKWGTKYRERIPNNSKSCTSLMFCGSGTGQILPIYVIYKALNIYQSWIERRPPNARYDWFDNDTFEDWFIKVFLPVAKTKEITALISINLSSHFSEYVLWLCRKYNLVITSCSTCCLVGPVKATWVCASFDTNLVIISCSNCCLVMMTRLWHVTLTGPTRQQVLQLMKYCRESTMSSSFVCHPTQTKKTKPFDVAFFRP